MGSINLKTFIKAPQKVCFDLSLSLDLHKDSVSETQERAIAGKTSGLIDLNEQVTWEAIHFGVKQQLTIKITKLERSHYFQDQQIKGIFNSFCHDHYFEETEDGTLMIDKLEIVCPLGALGKIVDPIVTKHLEKFLKQRNEFIKTVAESEVHKKYVS